MGTHKICKKITNVGGIELFLQHISCSTQINEKAIFQRFPAVLTEVKCLCDRPVASNRVRTSQTIECEPLHYQLRVLLFDDDCGSFKEAIETIGLACLPVIQVILVDRLQSAHAMTAESVMILA
jgi:hypothetical protein